MISQLVSLPLGTRNFLCCCIPSLGVRPVQEQAPTQSIAGGAAAESPVHGSASIPTLHEQRVYFTSA